MLSNARTPIVGIAAYSGSGKTTLLARLIPLFTAAGLRVGVIKHAHHRFDMDQPGKDSYRMREAGASQVLLGSRYRIALLVEQDQQRPDPCLNDMLGMLDQSRLDLILVEGFKHEDFPKLELNRPITGKPLMYPDDPTIIALVSDDPDAVTGGLPLLDLNRPQQVYEFIRVEILATAPTPPVTTSPSTTP